MGRISIHTLALTAMMAGRAWAFDPAAGDFAKADPSDVRVLSYNTLGNFVGNATITNNQLRRVITAINPDVIAFQEIDTGITAASIKATLEGYFPGSTWTVLRGDSDTFNRNALATRRGLSMTRTDTSPASDARGVTMGLVDLAGTPDLYVMAVHFKCCTTTDDHRRRQIYADAIINWMRDARTAGGFITLPAGTPMLVVGDMNLGQSNNGDEAPYHATRTLRDGDILDEGTFGADSAPDWDGSESEDAAPYDHTNADSDTWSSRDSNPGSRLDRFVYTDSVMRARNKFIVNTATMTAQARTAAGLQAADTDGASDHLPSAVDFAMGGDTNPAGRLLVNEFSYNDVGTDDRSFLEIINVGGRDVNLQAPLDHRIARALSGLPTTVPATENEVTPGFDLQGIVPAGGLFVLYDGPGDSAAIASTITSRLPALQRQSLTSFTLFDQANSAIALVTADPDHNGVVAYSLIDAYMFEDTTPSATNYWRTDTRNGLLITLGPGQSTSTSVVSDTMSLSRLRGDTVENSFAGWVIPDLATPGLPNNTARSTVEVVGWMLF